MHRMKIGLIAAIVLLAMTVGLYAVVTRELKESVVQDLDLAVSRAQRIHGDVARLEAMEFENLVGQHSHRAAVVGVFDKSSEDSRRQAILVHQDSQRATVVAISLRLFIPAQQPTLQ